MNNEDKRIEQTKPTGDLGRCKVCTKLLRAGEDHTKVFHAGSYYLVCCASCASKFEANPGAYLVT